MTDIARLKIELREEDIPFFSDAELEYYLSKHNGNFNATAYECCMVKAENTTLNVSGLSVADSSAYFRQLACKFRKNNTGTLKGG